MPPKRKRADDGASEASVASTRTTRSSARIARSRTATTKTEGTAEVADTVEVASQAKRVRKNMTKTAASRTQARGKGQPDTHETRADDSTQESVTTLAQRPAKSVKSSEPAPYSTAAAASLFNSYADPDDPTVIGPEGFERFCSDAEVSLEGALPLILAWQMNASEMAKISKPEWEKATSELRISNVKTLSTALHDLEDLLLLDKPALRPTASAPTKKPATGSCDPYNRSRYYGYATNTTKFFNELYAFCFTLAKPPQVRNIDMEVSRECAFWSVLVVPKYPLMSDILQFINEKGTYKGVNKDLWTMTLEFCRAVQPDLSNYDPEGAWPTMLDDFVTWKKNGAAGDIPM